MTALNTIITTKNLFIATLALTVASPFRLDAMKRLREIDNEQQDPAKKQKTEKHIDITLNDLANDGMLNDDAIKFGNNVKQYIVSFIKDSQFDTLQTTLDTLCKYATPLSIKAHKALFGYVKKSLNQDEIKTLFNHQLHGESTLKMALRLVYAQTHNANLDALDCVEFINNIGDWVNGESLGQAQLLFSQGNFQYVVGLLEPLIRVPVTSLDLYNYQLTELPDAIGNLVNLEEIDLSGNKLTNLSDAIVNLVKLEVLDLRYNQFTLETKQTLRQQFEYIRSFSI